MKVISGDKRMHQWQSELGARTWPEFMQHDNIVEKYWASLYSRFPEFQFAIFENNRLLGVGNSLPVRWDQSLGDLPGGGLDWAMVKANANFDAHVKPNILVGVQILVDPDYQGKGLSYKMLDFMKDSARKHGLTQVVLPVRPTLKCQYPLVPMDDYIYWVNEEKLPFDPWIRVHIRAGGRVIKTCHRSMDIRGTIPQWEKWTNMKFPASGDYIIDKALIPLKVDAAGNTGHYIEPNVWMAHNVS